MNDKMRCDKKKKEAMLLTGVMAVSLLMTGCQSTKGLENDNIKISVYKGVEVDKVDKPSEVTDDDVNTQIQSVLDENSTTEEVTTEKPTEKPTEAPTEKPTEAPTEAAVESVE